MVQYNYAFKKKVVEAYQNGAGGYPTLAKQFNIASFSTVRNWVKSVEKIGFKALHRRTNYQYYSSKFKQDVIHYYLMCYVQLSILDIKAICKVKNSLYEEPESSVLNPPFYQLSF
ncbi:helix-turn-helix domain-containing protein [Enterococcus faecalis]|uniref:helix-turn-helix domain-containing protein n=1 Tax=Enterococcus faecalis TaxID=1351 RepID=UPI0025B0F2F5|nr:helix-turn-helix domain-containing protein [Enterococcus faecalis]MDN3185482.1 helix-turn-helix domain-containing protein [Enterococcus faecalis]